MNHKILIVEDDQQQRDLWNHFFEASTKNVFVKYAINYEDAFGFLGEYFDIVCCDYFLSDHNMTSETGADFLNHYIGAHRKDKNSMEKPIAMLYSGAIDDIKRSNGYYIISRENIMGEVLKKINSIDNLKQQEEINMPIPGDVFSKQLCDERHQNVEKLINKIDKSLDLLFVRLNWFYLLAITTLISAISAIFISCFRG